ncbi:MAG: Gfo/Idh/MocA family oxidoreductase [Spirochaetaceae bacterium]|jgi:predicted dehydrogenase|nr:Gfo/Idh/MocA family oxidoreductase [Spirochaetaceae bacterium]
MEKIGMGFIGAGGIARKMADTIIRMDSVKPCAVAARDAERAQRFAAEFGFEKSYGSYDEMLDDPEVELVYIATPHSHHFDHAKLCLENGKHVLCEKAFTANAQQAEALIELARGKGLLLAEAIWTRYMPLSATLSTLLTDGVIGTVSALTANLGYLISTKERIKEPALAGGALLDVGVYPLNFALMALGADIERIVSAAVKMETGVDAQNCFTLCYRDGKMAILNSSALTQTDRRGVIYGDMGNIIVDNINNPDRLRIIGNDGQEKGAYERPSQISGYEYEVEAAVRAIREGAVECAEMPHSEILRVMKIMDSLRAEWGIRYPFE